MTIEAGEVIDDGGNSGDGAQGNATCSAAVACGAGGATYEECTTLGADGACLAIVYRVSDGHAFTCAGCTSCTATQQQLGTYCSSVTTVDAGPSDASVPDAAQDSGGGTTCQAPSACGTAGVTFRECTTTNGSGACESIDYQVSSGQTFTCTSCSDCSSAIQALNTFCVDDANPTTTCGTMTPCESSPLTYEVCTTTLGGNCQGTYYLTSNAQKFTCSACGDCASAVASLDAYCTSQTPIVTTCGAPTTCGFGGATYQACSTSQGSACLSAEYTTSTGDAFPCNSCSDCTTALTSVESYCASLTSPNGVLLFGGYATGGTALADTWIWNGSTWTAGPAGPAARADSQAAVLSGQVVVFGGTTDTSVTSLLGDTWAWSGSAWSELATAGPSARFGNTLTAVGSELVLFGGCTTDSAANDLADTWLWNGAARSSPAITGPAARVGAASATLNGQAVIFGGLDAAGAYLSDTWVFDGAAWTQVMPTVSPTARFYASMVNLGNQLVLFGGNDGADLSDLWTFDGANWTAVTATGPAARSGHSAATWNGAMVLFGGSSSGAYQSDTWVWNGSAWAAQGATGPQARFGAAMGSL
jgi:N-acetylneuraminic acid mutarotase